MSESKRAWGAGRSVRLHIRVTPEEHAAYTADASRWGKGVSEWAREVLSAQIAPGILPTTELPPVEQGED